MRGTSGLYLAALLLTCGLTGLRADSATGTLFYTTFSGGVNVHKVDYNFDGLTTFTLSNNTGLASTNGADGLLFAPDGKLTGGRTGEQSYGGDN